jgi:hypothetical protein
MIHLISESDSRLDQAILRLIEIADQHPRTEPASDLLDPVLAF